ncbi:Uncharacterized protein TCM_028108 [Theobroma cacao]|uniref:Uncharacterized protein n=1 Tax=Theobroma cacao TaxID=3641 RepID=A0A061GBB8_THECC|nr:Uncharacterized protein TCM_028108 [Theobroma cacao]
MNQGKCNTPYFDIVTNKAYRMQIEVFEVALQHNISSNEEKGNDSHSTEKGSMDSIAESRFVQECESQGSENGEDEENPQEAEDDLECDPLMCTGLDSYSC